MIKPSFLFPKAAKALTKTLRQKGRTVALSVLFALAATMATGCATTIKLPDLPRDPAMEATKIETKQAINLGGLYGERETDWKTLNHLVQNGQTEREDFYKKSGDIIHTLDDCLKNPQNYSERLQVFAKGFDKLRSEKDPLTIMKGIQVLTNAPLIYDKQRQSSNGAIRSFPSFQETIADGKTICLPWAAIKAALAAELLGKENSLIIDHMIHDPTKTNFSAHSVCAAKDPKTKKVYILDLADESSAIVNSLENPNDYLAAQTALLAAKFVAFVEPIESYFSEKGTFIDRNLLKKERKNLPLSITTMNKEFFYVNTIQAHIGNAKYGLITHHKLPYTPISKNEERALKMSLDSIAGNPLLLSLLSEGINTNSRVIVASKKIEEEVKPGRMCKKSSALTHSR